MPFVELGDGTPKFHGQFVSHGNEFENICAETHCRIRVYGDDFVGQMKLGKPYNLISGEKLDISTQHSIT